MSRHLLVLAVSGRARRAPCRIALLVILPRTERPPTLFGRGWLLLLVGKMKYDNGIFYEGNWVHGYKDESRDGATSAATSNVTRNRILGGFTSWKGAAKKDGGANGGTYVYGMDWADLRGMPGKYTGHVDADENPEGEGVMKYEFGLVVEGQWRKGLLMDQAGGNTMMPAPMSQTVVANGGMTVAPGGMSVAGGGATVVSGLGMMSIGGTGGGVGMWMMGMGGYPPHMMHNQSNMVAPADTVVHCNPAGTMREGAAPASVIYQQHQQHGMMVHQAPIEENPNIWINI